MNPLNTALHQRIPLSLAPDEPVLVTPGIGPRFLALFVEERDGMARVWEPVTETDQYFDIRLVERVKKKAA